jgi:hypothetical protein
VLGAANVVLVVLDPVVLVVLDPVVLVVLDPVVLVVLDPVVVVVLDSVVLVVLDAVVVWVVVAALLWVVVAALLWVVVVAGACVVVAAVLCVAGAVVVCVLCVSVRSGPRGSVVVTGLCGPLMQFGHGGGSSGTAYANPGFCVTADMPTLAATAAAPTARFIDIPILRPLPGFGPDNGWLPSRPSGESTPPGSRGRRGGVG